MESPNYAKWIPGAGGYVHNGSIVSTNPLYDETGRQLVDVDISQLQVPGTQANQTGSKTDSNANITNIGSMASTSLNTENPDLSVLNTPATRSASAGEPVLSPVDQTLKDIAYHQAHNNLQGMINGYTTLQQQTGEDWSQMINNLHQQRNKKILDQDNAYGQAITEAYVSGDTKKVAQLQQEQADWRNNVGFGEVQKVDYQMKQDDIQIQYEDAYLTGFNDIMNNLMNTFSDSLGQLLNFQYNPNTDLRLQVAQGYAVGAVKEQMNHTGMYYSSMTQNAITRAVGELVPVYEQMARQEMQENIQMLMNVGNFLMNIEQTQFNMWKGQIEVQLELNQEKRRQYQDAMDRANAWGYVSNEDAVILGVAPGSPSPKALEEARKAQSALDEEQRELYSKLIVADFENTLAMQKMIEEKRLDASYEAQKQYRDYQYNIAEANNDAYNKSLLSAQEHEQDMELQRLKNTTSKNSSAGTLANDIANTLGSAGFSEDVSTKMTNLIEGESTASQIKKFFKDSKLTEDSFSSFDEMIESNIEKMKDAVNGPFDDSTIRAKYKEEKELAIEQGNATLLSTFVAEKIMPEINGAIELNFGEDYKKTTDALNSALDIADNYASILAGLDYETRDAEIAKIYENIVDEINGAGQFDYSWLNLHDDYNELKSDAEKDIVDRIKKNKSLGDSADRIADAVNTYIGNIQAGLTDESGNYLKPNYRDDLINNTLREADRRIEGIYNVGSRIASDVINSPITKRVVTGVASTQNPILGIANSAVNIAKTIESRKKQKEG